MLMGWWQWRCEGSQDDALELYRALAQYGMVPVEDFIARSDWEEWAADLIWWIVLIWMSERV
jgi:hypothetical protein